MWILIVYTTMQFGAAVTFTEYPSHQACDGAAEWLNSKPAVSAICQYKGEEPALR